MIPRLKNGDCYFRALGAAVLTLFTLLRSAAIAEEVRVYGGNAAADLAHARRLPARFVSGWNARGPKARTGAAKEERQ